MDLGSEVGAAGGENRGGEIRGRTQEGENTGGIESRQIKRFYCSSGGWNCKFVGSESTLDPSWPST